MLDAMLKSLFKSKQQVVLGIDIGVGFVKIIELSCHSGIYFVEGYGYDELSPGVVDHHAIKDIDAVVLSIKRIIQQSRLKATTAIFAVPDADVITKILQVNDGLSMADIEEFIGFEADKHIPYPIDEIHIDFEVLGPAKNPNMQDVLLVASRSENINTRIEIATKAGLKIDAVDVESFAIERALQLLARELPAAGENKVIAVMDIGEENSSLFVFYDMRLIYTRENEFGSKQLSREIANYYGITEVQALNLKAQNSLPADYETEVLMPYIDELFMHIKRSLQFFFSTSTHSSVDKLLLAGNMSELGHLAKLMQDKGDIPCSIANPLQYLRLGKHLNEVDMNQQASSLLIACGLALRLLT